MMTAVKRGMIYGLIGLSVLGLNSCGSEKNVKPAEVVVAERIIEENIGQQDINRQKLFEGIADQPDAFALNEFYNSNNDSLNEEYEKQLAARDNLRYWIVDEFYRPMFEALDPQLQERVNSRTAPGYSTKDGDEFTWKQAQNLSVYGGLYDEMHSVWSKTASTRVYFENMYMTEKHRQAFDKIHENVK